jgi:hypothetical protein
MNFEVCDDCRGFAGAETTRIRPRHKTHPRERNPPPSPLTGAKPSPLRHTRYAVFRNV